MIVTVDGFCRIRYGDRLGADGRPTKSQRNTVSAMCRRGTLKGAFKAGKAWLIDLDEVKREGSRQGSAETPHQIRA